MNKGDYGYLKHRQNHLFRMVLFCAAAVLILVLIGFVIWHTRFNIMMMPAMLCVIPLANFVASYLAVVSYHSAPESRHDALKEYEQADMLLSDLIIVDPDGKRSGLDFALIYKNGIVGFQSRTKDSKDRIEITINDSLKRRGIPMRIKVYRDWEEFLQRVSEIPAQVEEDSVKRVNLARETVLNCAM